MARSAAIARRQIAGLICVTVSMWVSTVRADRIVIAGSDALARTAVAALDELEAGTWRAVVAAPRRETTGAREPIAELRSLYIDASFVPCMERLRAADLDVERLLGDGARDDAAEIAALGSACTFGAGDEPGARRLLREALIRQLDLAPAIQQTNRDHAALVDSVRRELDATPRAAVTIRTHPAGARVSVDGDPLRCTATPCTVPLFTGRHLFRAESLGYQPAVVSRDVLGETRLELPLELADSDAVAGQVTLALSQPIAAAERERLMRTAADAFDASSVVLVVASRSRVTAALFDREVDRVVATASAANAAAAPAVRSALAVVVGKWRRADEPTLLERPLFWVGVGAVVAGGIVTYLLLRDDSRLDVGFE